jgi:hypothetical protein
MHSGVGKNLAHRFHGAVSQPAIRREKRQHLSQDFFRRTNVSG